MSSFSVEARRLTILPHDNADALEIAQVDGYQSIVKKGDFHTGELGLYIPEQAIVPGWILDRIGLNGKLHGAGKDRVKTIRLRGVLSQGLVVKPYDVLLATEKIVEGVDYAELLGISKWVPSPGRMFSGKTSDWTEWAYVCDGIHAYTDIENIKKWPNVLREGEMVQATEKIHGTCSIFYLNSEGIHVSSKGVAGRGFALNMDEENIYWQMLWKYDLGNKLRRMADRLGIPELFLFGETYGKVQDLQYGVVERDFRAFELADNRAYFAPAIARSLMESEDIPLVPLLDSFKWNYDHAKELAAGTETVSGQSLHMREGTVIRPFSEKRDPKLGRVILKVINDDYLLRKGDTTEFE